jgi:hypothetical protein
MGSSVTLPNGSLVQNEPSIELPMLGNEVTEEKELETLLCRL